MINCEDVKFEHPANWVIGAPSQSGKSYLVYQILKNSDILIRPSFKEIIYCYSEWQPLYEKMITDIKNITFVKGLPELDTVENAFVILDDLMNEVIEDKRLLTLFTVGSHHRKISVIFLTQNIYEKGRYARSISLNAHYLIIFNVDVTKHKLVICLDKFIQMMENFLSNHTMRRQKQNLDI